MLRKYWGSPGVSKMLYRDCSDSKTARADSMVFYYIFSWSRKSIAFGRPVFSYSLQMFLDFPLSPAVSWLRICPQRVDFPEFCAPTKAMVKCFLVWCFIEKGLYSTNFSLNPIFYICFSNFLAFIWYFLFTPISDFCGYCYFFLTFHWFFYSNILEYFFSWPSSFFWILSSSFWSFSRAFSYIQLIIS